MQCVGVGEFALDDVDETHQRIGGQELRQARLAIAACRHGRAPSGGMEHQLLAEGTGLFALGGLPGDDLVPLDAVMLEDGAQEFQQVGGLVDDLAPAVGVEKLVPFLDQLVAQGLSKVGVVQHAGSKALPRLLDPLGNQVPDKLVVYEWPLCHAQSSVTQ